MLISTTHGEIDDSLLQKREGNFENDVEKTSWIEYWDGGNEKCLHPMKPEEHHCLCGAEKVHRSVRMHLKKPMVWGLGVAEKMPGG